MPSGRSDMPAQPQEPPLPAIPGVVLHQWIARGGMGVVYRGEQEYLGREVAVKVLAPHLQTPDFMARFQREARILSGITHQHIVLCYQAGATETGTCYLVMEFIDGPTLAAHTFDTGAVAVEDAMALCRDLARALAHAHKAGIIHRDIKPENVLLQRRPDATASEPFPFVPKLVDLGLARTGDTSHDLTAPGMVMGTYATMAPEQFLDPDNVDYRADIYGLGCVLYHALTGAPAFPGQPLRDVLARKAAPFGPDPRAIRPAVSVGLAELTQRMLAHDRADRPQSYLEIIEAIGALFDQTPELVDPHATTVEPSLAPVADRVDSGEGTPSAAPESRRRRIVLASVAVAAIAGIWWSLWQGGPPVVPSVVPLAATIESPLTVRAGERLVLTAKTNARAGTSLRYQWSEPTGLLPSKFGAPPGADRAAWEIESVEAFPDGKLTFRVDIDDGEGNDCSAEAEVAVVAGGTRLFLGDDPLVGWDESSYSGSWSQAMTPDTINAVSPVGEAGLERDLGAGDFVLSGSIELRPMNPGGAVAEAAGLSLSWGDGAPLGLAVLRAEPRAEWVLGESEDASAWTRPRQPIAQGVTDAQSPRIRFLIGSRSGKVSVLLAAGGKVPYKAFVGQSGTCRLRLFVRGGLAHFIGLRRQ